MSSAAQSLIHAVEARGGILLVDGEDLVIRPKSAATPLLEELRRHKAEIIAELARRPPMPPGVRLIRWEPKTPPVQLPSGSTVVEIELFARTTLQQLDAHLKGKTWLAGNWGLSALLARLEAVGCFVALEDPRLALQ
jgi:hypothetical protein